MTEQRSEAENRAAERIAYAVRAALTESGLEQDQPVWDEADQQYLIATYLDGMTITVAVSAVPED